jgi:hypothetical protein
MAISTESTRLRVIGQELDERRVGDFEITIDEGTYHVRALSLRGGAARARVSGLRALFGFGKAPVESWERAYSRSEVEWLDRQNRAHRLKNGVPDDYATSQMLRVVGAYAEQCGWVLTGVGRFADMLEIRYRDAHGTAHTLTQRFAELYDFSFHMSGARAGAADPSARQVS